MVMSLVLDAMIVIVLLSIIPLGIYRGGLREVCASAGVLLGVVLAAEWSRRWGDWVAAQTGIEQGVSRFLVAVMILLLTTAIIGYGASGTFGYVPGPGGRIYGGLLGLINGAVFIGYVINFVSVFLFDGQYPDIIENAYVARALSVGVSWILLVSCGLLLLAMGFSMLVRERGEEMPIVGASSPSRAAAPTQTMELQQPEQEPSQERSAPMRIREIRHWEEDEGARPPVERPGGWQRTWPAHPASQPRQSAPGRPRPQRSAPERPDREQGRDGTAQQRSASSTQDQDSNETLREWLETDEDSS